MQRSLTDWQQLHGNAFHNTRVLVTGGAGFIGSHLVEALLQLGANVVALDDLSGGSRENLADFPTAQFVEGSILDRDLLASIMTGCTFVFHQAALGSVPRSVEQPALYHEVNATGTLNVLETARHAGVKRLTFAASSSAYGDTEVLPKVETMPPMPLSPYAATKAAAEALVRAYACSYGLDAVSLRYFNIFGPRQNANSAYAAVIAAFAKAVLTGQPPVIFGDGEQSRDFAFIHNAIHANLLAARSERPLGGEVVNIACGQRITVNTLADMVTRILQRPDLKPVYKPERPGDVKHSLADLTRARRLIGYGPIVDFQPGLEQTLHWYRQTLG